MSLLHVKQVPVCSKCTAAPPAPGHRYCKLCKATYMRAWRETKVVVDRDAAERAGLTAGRQSRTPIKDLPPIGG